MCDELRDGITVNEAGEAGEAGGTCETCGREFGDDVEPCGADHPDADGVCIDCFWEDHATCDDCGAVVRDEDSREDMRHRRRGSTLCESCWDEHHVSCNGCGRNVVRDDASTGPDGEEYCGGCWSDQFFYCEGCDTDRCSDDYAGDGLCVDCAEDESGVLDYDVDVLDYVKFFGKPADGLFFGVELEVEASGDVGDKVDRCLSAIGRDFAIAKRDGSLNHGFEIVTAPATLDIQRDRWRRFFDANVRGIRSWDTSTCGMHVHVSRDALSPFTLGKVLVFINDPDNYEFVTKIAGRESSRWAAFEPGRKLADAVKGSTSRYRAVNLENSNTIEFRIFQGTLNRDSFIKNLEFVAALVKFARFWGPGEMNAAEFIAYVEAAPKLYPHLTKWLRAKGFMRSTQPTAVGAEV